MRHHRAFSPCPLIEGETVELDERESHHLGTVLRMSAGDEAILLNGAGQEALALVTGSGKRLRVRVQRLLRNEFSPTAARAVCCALTKSGAFEPMITHATELGMTQFFPLHTDRTMIDFDARREEKKHLKWQALCIDALKQSERLWLPIIHPVQPLSEALRAATDVGFTAVVLAERETAPPLATLSLSAPAFFVGPEGGWSVGERALFQQQSIQRTSLGSGILRTETAVLAALAICLSEESGKPC